MICTPCSAQGDFGLHKSTCDCQCHAVIRPARLGDRLRCGGIVVQLGALLEDVESGDRFRAMVCTEHHYHPVSWRTE